MEQVTFCSPLLHTRLNVQLMVLVGIPKLHWVGRIGDYNVMVRG